MTARFEAWAATGRAVADLRDHGDETGDSFCEDTAPVPGRLYQPGFMQADGEGWSFIVCCSEFTFPTLAEAERKLWDEFASDEFEAA